MSAEPDDGFEPLLRYIRGARGFDFTAYKRPGLRRRVTRRLESLGLGSYEAYQDYLEVHPEEFPRLFDGVLINVTTFFREPASWDFLARQVVPEIVAGKEGDEPIRIWSAGCASGQEAYTLAIVLCETLGEDAFRRRVKIYATDLDVDALAEARRGSYTHKQVEDVPQGLLPRYFEDRGTRYQFRSDLRRMITFGRHDVTSDAPISRLDLLVCRNTLMYFIAETQQRVATRFHYALREGAGYLFLGKAETISVRGDLFHQVDPRHRIYRRGDGAAGRLIVPDLVWREPEEHSPDAIRHRALEQAPVAQVLVDVGGALAFANSQARAAFGVRQEDVGRPFQDLELSFRPVELRSRIEQAIAERGEVRITGVERPLPDGRVQHLEVTVTPILREGGQPLGTGISFSDVSEMVELKEQAHRSDQELETTGEELQSTNEELETSNEELQSTNEELETTNEELQSTNEELETLNEELHSTNEELRRAHSELREERRAYQELFDFAPDGYLITNSYGTIRLCNVAASRLLAGGRGDAMTGKPLTVFVALEHRTSFFVALERARRTGQRTEWTGRLVPRGDGGSFPASLVVVGRPDRDGDSSELLWQLHDLRERERFERALRASEEAFRALAENSPDPIVRLDPGLRIEYANAAAERLIGRRAGELVGARAEDAGLAAEAAEPWAASCARALGGAAQTVEVPVEAPSGLRWLESRIVPERGAGGSVDRLLVVSRDVTERRNAEQALRDSDDLKSAMLASVSHELRTPLTAIAAAAEALTRAAVPDPGGLLDLITGETTRLERMVANLLDLSRLQGSAVVPRPEVYPVETLVGSALEAVEGALGAAPVRVDMDDDAPLVMADPLMCERILVNLLHNAVTHGAPPVRLTSRADGRIVHIAVTDAGPGIPPGDEQRVFQPFIHGGRPGSAGIGLALARALAEAQGARLDLRRDGRPGACFVLSLPAATIQAERRSDEPGVAPAAARG